MQKRILLGLVGLCAALLFSWSAYASHIDVNSTDDVMDNEDGKCTLREAIKVANYGVTFGKAVGECTKTGEGELKTIHLPDGNYKLEIPYQIKQGFDIHEDNDGLFDDLDIKGNLVIEAKDKGTVTIDGGGIGRIFDIVSQDANVSLNNLILQNGKEKEGGAIRNLGVLTVKDCEIKNNQAQQGYSFGGGIYNENSLTVINSLIADNKASTGGGIYNGYGGNVNGTAVISNSVIKNNSATNGGGIENTENMNLTDSSIIGNKASDYAGGLENSGTVSITHSLISGNEAISGGGGVANTYDGTLDIENSTITKNVSKAKGNAIYNGKDAHASVANTTFHYNVGGSGIAIFNNSPGENFVLQNVILLVNASNECEGEFTSNGGNIIGNVPNCALTLKPTDKTYQTYDKIKFGTFVDLVKPGKAYYPLLAGSIALSAGEETECEKKDQVHNSRKAKCDSGAIEARCGDGIVHSPEEQCDDENDKDNDACRNDCKKAKCGDGIVWAGKEKCDDGNKIDTDTCSNGCVSVNKAECLAGYKWSSVVGACLALPGTCPSGKIVNQVLGCTKCTGEGEYKNADKTVCLCTVAYEADATGVCIKKTCPAGQALNMSSGNCASKGNILKATPR